jgi:hypothetical protein
MSEQKQSLLERWANILTPFILAAVGYFIHSERLAAEAHADAHSDAQVAGLYQTVTANYVTKVDHDSDVTALKAWDQKLAEGEQKLADGQNIISINVEHIKDLAERNQNQNNQ